MTRPRRHLPNQVVTITRRVVDRRSFLRPDEHIKAVVEWELAKASTDHGMDVHGMLVMSNHPHIFITDRTGERSRFMQDFCSGVARARNIKLNHTGRFWDNQQFGDTVVWVQADIVEKLLYVWLNPVRAGLVRRAADWPGAKILPCHWGETVEISVPNDGFYRTRRKRKVVKFTPTPPPGFEHLSLEEVKAYFEERLREEEDRIAAQMRKRGRKFRGRAWVERQSHMSVPVSRASPGSLNPRFACRDAESMKRALAAYRTFLDEYGRTRKRWLKGAREVTFPAGTIQLRHRTPIRCSGPPPDEPTTQRVC